MCDFVYPSDIHMTSLLSSYRYATGIIYHSVFQGHACPNRRSTGIIARGLLELSTPGSRFRLANHDSSNVAAVYAVQYYIPGFPGNYNATVSIDGSAIVLNGATMYVNQPLGSLGEDLMQVCAVYLFMVDVLVLCRVRLEVVLLP